MIERANYNNHKIEKAKDLISFIIDQLNKELRQPNNFNFITPICELFTSLGL